ncbi:MAG: hypothetical protein GXP54_06670 [Deltaproteobacteria bacterium]|nr:hypothetical protein [Deltaproteobacteria bacterium]
MSRELRNIPGLLCLVAMLLWPTTGSASKQADLAHDLLQSPDGEIQETFSGFKLVSAKLDYGIHFVFSLDISNPVGKNIVEVVLTARDDSVPALARTASFNVDFKGPMTGSRPAPELRPLVEKVIATVKRNDSGGLVIPTPPSPEARAPGSKPWIHPAMAWIGLALVMLFFLLLPATGRWVVDDLSRSLGARSWLVGLAGITAAGLALRLAVPHMPVMYYMGYRLAQDAAALDVIPKYGSGALALYHMIFYATGPSHVVMAWTNSIIGAFLPVAGAAVLARMGASRVAVLSSAALLAFSPVFIKDASTESILVPTMLWTLLGLHQFLRYRESRRVPVMAAGWVHLLLAMYSRPEAVVLPAFCLVLLWWFAPKHEGASPRKAWLWLVLSLLAAHGLILIRVSHLSMAMGVEFARGSSPVLKDPIALLNLIPEFLTRNLVFRPALFPVGVLVLAGLALVNRKSGLKALALVVCASVWLCVDLVDLPYVSIPRVQIPGAVFLTLAGGLGAGVLWETASQRIRSITLARTVKGLATMAVVSSMLVTIPSLWAPVNADYEERLLREARDLLPDEPVIFVRRSYEDQPEERVHLYYPDYWFVGNGRNDVVVGPEWFSKMDTAGRPAYFLLGTRCYMRKCGETGMHPSCRMMLDHYRLRPLVERTVPVLHAPIVRWTRPDQDLDFPWCLSDPKQMKIGFYRILGPKG